jgi:hypothetical protein
MENALHRIKKYIDYKEISVRAFEQRVGMSNGSFASQLKNGRTIGVDRLENILREYPELNAAWILTGEGEMLKSAFIPIKIQGEGAEPATFQHKYYALIERYADTQAELSRLYAKYAAVLEGAR